MIESIALMFHDFYRKNPYVEHYDVIMVNEYMKLDNLAKLLDELIKKFSGIFTDLICIKYS